MNEKNTRPVRISSERTVRKAAPERGNRSPQNTPKKNTQKPAKKAPAAQRDPMIKQKSKPQGFLTVRNALIIAAAAVVLICAPLGIYAISASAAKNQEAEENLLGIQPVTAEPTGEETVVSDPQGEDGETDTGEGDTQPDATGENTTGTYKQGDTSGEVARIQARLMALGYMAKAETTEYFGTATESALKLFQKVEGLTEDGIAGAEVQKKLFAENTAFFTLAEGSKNAAVMQMQQRLSALKYLSAEATGYFGSETAKAVKNFQRKNGLTVDGKVGISTWNKLNGSDAVKADAGNTAEQS